MSRFTEPSTWAGLASLAQIVSAFLPAPYQALGMAVAAAAGGAAVSLREKPAVLVAAPVVAVAAPPASGP